MNEERNTPERAAFWDWLPRAYRMAVFATDDRFSRHNMQEAHAEGWRCAMELCGVKKPSGPAREVERALLSAAQQFRIYAESHAAKKTADGDAKSAVNARMAAMCQAALEGHVAGQCAGPHLADMRGHWAGMGDPLPPPEDLYAKLVAIHADLRKVVLAIAHPLMRVTPIQDGDVAIQVMAAAQCGEGGCPRCGAPYPGVPAHAVRHGGEVGYCPHPFHEPNEKADIGPELVGLERGS
jgi:hypothetical protein